MLHCLSIFIQLKMLSNVLFRLFFWPMGYLGVCHLICKHLPFSRALLFFLWIQVALCCHFLSAQRIPFSISCKAGLLATNSLNISLSGNVFISPSSLKNTFVRFRNFLFLSIFWVCHSTIFRLHCFRWKVSDRIASLYMRNCFSVSVFKIFSFLWLSTVSQWHVY